MLAFTMDILICKVFYHHILREARRDLIRLQWYKISLQHASTDGLMFQEQIRKLLARGDLVQMK